MSPLAKPLPVGGKESSALRGSTLMTPDKLVSPSTDAVPALPLSETGPATDVEIEAAPALPFAALGPVTLSPFFKLIFTSVVAIAGISLCASICLGIYLSYQPNNSA